MKRSENTKLGGERLNGMIANKHIYLCYTFRTTPSEQQQKIITFDNKIFVTYKHIFSVLEYSK